MTGDRARGDGLKLHQGKSILGEVPSVKGGQVLEQAARGSGGNTIPGSAQKMRRCGTRNLV